MDKSGSPVLVCQGPVRKDHGRDEALRRPGAHAVTGRLGLSEWRGTPHRAPSDRQYALSAPLVLTNHTISPTKKNQPSSRTHRPVTAVTGGLWPRREYSWPTSLEFRNGITMPRK